MMFFGMIHKHYNSGFELPNNFKKRVEAHFDYKWSYDRTMAVSSEEDLAIIDQLPAAVQDRLMCEYLFVDFLKLFGFSYFSIKKMVVDPKNPG